MVSQSENTMLDTQHQTANGSVMDVRGLNTNMEFGLVSSERRMTTDAHLLQESAGEISPVFDSSMDVAIQDASPGRQGRSSNSASPIERQALAEAPERLPRILDNSRQRSVLQHRTRPALHRDHLYNHRRGDFRSLSTAVYEDDDSDDPRAHREYNLLRQREYSAGRLRQKAQTELVAAMADIGSREERDDRRDDRRDRGGYRGGNKRRRDGKLYLYLRRGLRLQHRLGWRLQDITLLLHASVVSRIHLAFFVPCLQSFSHDSTNPTTQTAMTTIIAAMTAETRDAATMTPLAADMRSPHSPSCVGCS